MAPTLSEAEGVFDAVSDAERGGADAADAAGAATHTPDTGLGDSIGRDPIEEPQIEPPDVEPPQPPTETNTAGGDLADAGGDLEIANPASVLEDVDKNLIRNFRNLKDGEELSEDDMKTYSYLKKVFSDATPNPEQFSKLFDGEFTLQNVQKAEKSYKLVERLSGDGENKITNFDDFAKSISQGPPVGSFVDGAKFAKKSSAVRSALDKLPDGLTSIFPEAQRFYKPSEIIDLTSRFEKMEADVNVIVTDLLDKGGEGLGEMAGYGKLGRDDAEFTKFLKGKDYTSIEKDLKKLDSIGNISRLRKVAGAVARNKKKSLVLLLLAGAGTSALALRLTKDDAAGGPPKLTGSDGTDSVAAYNNGAANPLTGDCPPIGNKSLTVNELGAMCGSYVFQTDHTLDGESCSSPSSPIKTPQFDSCMQCINTAPPNPNDGTVGGYEIPGVSTVAGKVGDELDSANSFISCETKYWSNEWVFWEWYAYATMVGVSALFTLVATFLIIISWFGISLDGSGEASMSRWHLILGIPSWWLSVVVLAYALPKVRAMRNDIFKNVMDTNNDNKSVLLDLLNLEPDSLNDFCNEDISLRDIWWVCGIGWVLSLLSYIFSLFNQANKTDPGAIPDLSPGHDEAEGSEGVLSGGQRGGGLPKKSKGKKGKKLNRYNKWLIIILLIFAILISYFYNKNISTIQKKNYLQELKKERSSRIKNLEKEIENNNQNNIQEMQGVQEIQETQPLIVFGGRFL